MSMTIRQEKSKKNRTACGGRSDKRSGSRRSPSVCRCTGDLYKGSSSDGGQYALGISKISEKRLFNQCPGGNGDRAADLQGKRTAQKMCDTGKALL